jgi:hypothetical protein
MPSEANASLDRRNPFITRHAATMTREQLLGFRVDRDRELARCVELLFQGQSNVLMYGERGIGKTFLTHLVCEDLRSKHPDVLVSYLNLVGLGFYGRNEAAVGAFPNAVLLELCTTIWRTVLGLEYSALRSRIGSSPSSIKWESDAEACVGSMFLYLMSASRHYRFERENSIGAAALVKGEMVERSSHEYVALDLLPFEFFHLVDELCERVLRPKGKQQVIVICDEANHLPLREQSEIIGRYLELFAVRQIRFVVVVRPVVARRSLAALTTFEELELKGFPRQEDVAEMLNRYSIGSPITILDEAIEVVWETFEGRPLDTLLAAGKAHDEALIRGCTAITSPIMAKASAYTLADLRRAQERGDILE